MLVRKYGIPLLAVVGVAFAVYTVRSENRPVIPAQPVAEPARSPFEQPVAGAGIIEASTENIAVGAQVPGVVTRVLVKVGDTVKTVDPLFAIDDRAARAEVEVRKSAVAVSEQNLIKLENAPRPEDVPPAEAKVTEARAQHEDARTQLSLWESVTDPRAVARDELNKRRFAADSASARLAEAEADLARLRAGTWKPDLEIARAQVESARAQLKSAETDLDRLTVRALVDGQVLQLNVRPGEYAASGVLDTPLVLLGNTETLHVRVDVDENDAWRIRADSRAHASLRGNRSLGTELRFVRIEPYVVPKRSLTGDSTERVDTRVLQVLYSFKRGALPAYVGQLMDVFIDSPPSGNTGQPAGSGEVKP
jgi:HlyD family secretion protein